MQPYKDQPHGHVSKAVVFTHFGSLQYGKDDDEWNDREPEYEADFAPILRNYLLCAQNTTRLGVVYVYIDSSLKKLLLTTADSVAAKDRIRLVDAELLDRERNVKGFLRNLERSLRDELGLRPDEFVRIRYVGIEELLSLLNSLVAVDDSLVNHLSGPRGRFTYDSPKFVEAILRLARLDLPHLANDPIVRIDEDVLPTSQFFDCLLEQYDLIKRKSPYYFFSGHYSYDGTHSVNEPSNDPPSRHFLNDYAVRLQYFVREGYKSGDDPGEKVRSLVRTFLADLDQIGATQFIGSHQYYSPALSEMLKNGRKAVRPHHSAQVISGAGLIMSRRAIDLLPPFMNLSELVVWIDDHLKRRLHETIHDVKPSSRECIDGATIRQDRHPGGVTADNISSAEEYLQRLLRGCMFRRLLSDLDDKPSNYALLIEDVVRYRVREGDARLSGPDLDSLKSEMLDAAAQRFREVLKCWSQEMYEGTFLRSWALKRTNDPDHQSKTAEEVVNDAIKYLGLVVHWHIFVRAVQRLGFNSNDWLFE